MLQRWEALMPGTGLFLLSMLCFMGGVSFALFPHALLKLSKTLNRSLLVLDVHLMRYRYLVGFLFMLTGYGVFQLALMLNR